MYLSTRTISNSILAKLLIFIRNNLTSNVRRIRTLMRLPRRNVNMIGVEHTTNNLVNQGRLYTMTHTIRLIRGLLHRQLISQRHLRRMGGTNTLTKDVNTRARHTEMIIRTINNLDQMTTTIPSNITPTINPLPNFRRGTTLRTKRNRTIMMTYLRGTHGIVVNLQNLIQRGRHLRRTYQNVGRHGNIPHHEINGLRLYQFRYQTISLLSYATTTTFTGIRGTPNATTHRRRHHYRRGHHPSFFVRRFHPHSVLCDGLRNAPYARSSRSDVSCSTTRYRDGYIGVYYAVSIQGDVLADERGGTALCTNRTNNARATHFVAQCEERCLYLAGSEALVPGGVDPA